MTGKMKKYILGLFSSLAALFLWILIAVLLTGGRDVGEFTSSDKNIMTVFIIVEIATGIVMFAFAILLGNEYGKTLRQPVVIPETKGKKRLLKRGTVLLIVAYVLALGLVLGGIILNKNTVLLTQSVCEILLLSSCTVSVIVLLLSVILKRWYAGRLEKQQIGQVQQFVYSHRDRAQETAAQKLSFLRRWRRLTDVYALSLGLAGACVALCAGVLYGSGGAVTFCFVGVLLIMCAFSRIRFRQSQGIFEENRAYVSRDQYPHLYEQAERAAKTIGCSGDIRIAILTDCNAGISKIGTAYSIHLGAILVCALSSEELYSVLLHEFAHMTGRNGKEIKEHRYSTWLREGRIDNFLTGITDLFFAFSDEVYKLQFSLYDYASSVLIETAADQAMLLYGNPEAAASALTKIAYYDLFSWEQGTEDESCVYEQEQPEKHFLEKELQRFLSKMECCSEKWNELLNREIHSRAATHPTLKMRLETLGIQNPRLIEMPVGTDYAEECRKALNYVDEQIYENIAENYEDRRRVFFLEPKSQVEVWEENGKPVIDLEYADIVEALRQLGKNTEALALCQRAIESLPKAAGATAYFVRGCHRLHSYDAAGIEDIYMAIEYNSNFFNEGVDTIGTFCCLTGNQKELDAYRQKGVILAQKYKDEYSQAGVLSKKDRLSSEKLPDGMLEQILDYIRNVDDGQIEKIYLVRKTITADFFTSVFVIRFDLQADEELCGKIMHKVFRYLDTCSDWQFSLFDYQDVMRVPFYKIENSCVYSKKGV